MGNDVKTKDVVLLFDTYSKDSENLHVSFKLAGKEYPVVVIEDDGFLPEGAISVYEYFLGDFKSSEKVPGKPRYFNQITVPEYWEISGTNSSGKIHNLNKERGRIFYAEPKHKRLVKVVDWYDDRGIVRASDHYNKYGALYARTIFNAKGQRVNKSYFDANGAEIIVENFVTKNIILNYDGKVKIFPNKKEFVVFFMKQTGYENYRIFFNTLSTSFFVSQALSGEKEDVLFWQEPERNDIPGNMTLILNGTASRTTKIMVQNKKAHEKLLALGATPEKLESIGYIYSFKKENTHRPEVLICTNSDRIAECEKIVQALPEMHFYIVAITEMSSKLMEMDKYDNVSLYPGIKMKILEELFEKCDFYLDINHEAEIVSAVEKAFLHNHLIFAFNETMHNARYIAPEHVYAISDADKMISDMKMLLLNPSLLDSHIQLQHTSAQLECDETYQKI